MKTDIQLEQETQIESKEKSFKSFYKKWVNILTNYAHGYLKDNETSTSVVHDIFINFHSNEVKADNLQAYLFRSVRNASLNALEKQKRKHLEFTDPNELTVISDSKQQAVVKMRESEQLLLLQNLINQLPEKRQRVFKMHRLEGYSYAEIAQQLGISTRTVEDHLAKSMNFLHEHMHQLLNN